MTHRNRAVEQAVQVFLDMVDDASAGRPTDLPPPQTRRSVDAQLMRPASTRLASAFLLAYSLCDPEWDREHIPIGLRGRHGDKRLASELSKRNVTLHDNVTAFGENLGWKGNVGQFRLSTDDRFASFIAEVRRASETERRSALRYFAGTFADSIRVQQPLPRLHPDVLTFARARELFSSLSSLPAEGHVQQFIIAELLRKHRARFGHEIRTHHPHASDAADAAAGDVEELRGTQLVAAYEVTVRADWKNRLQDFRQKMADHGLAKYWIIANNVYGDEDLDDPSRMLEFLGPAQADLAVVDLGAFLDVFVAELSAEDLRIVVNRVYEDLTNPRLSGRQDFIEAYRHQVAAWLDSLS